jgi:hypothetical protein
MRRLAFALLLATLAAPSRAGADAVASLTVPIVISTSGLAGSFYTSELTLTNRGTTAATLRFTYTAAFGGGGGSGTDTLGAGRQKIVPDAIEYLISIGVPIPATGNRGGVVRVDFAGLSSADAGTVTVRTTSAVTNGHAGLAYSAFRAGLGGPSYLCGLRQNATDRSNVALLNAGAPDAGDVVLRLTIFSGDPAAPATRVLPDVRLAPGGFTQFTEILKGVGLDRGWVRIAPVAGKAPYYAYATILDQTTSDGSFVPPLGEAAVYTTGGATLPVVVETSAFSTEVVVANVAEQPVTVRLAYVADEVHTADNTATVELALAPREQRVIPAFVPYLRSQGAAGVGGTGPTFAGALTLTVVGDDVGGVFLGGRTQTSGGGGRYGLFYTAVPHGEAPTDTAWIYGLQQNAENRANLALVNTGEADGSALTLKVEIFDGASGAVAKSSDVTLGARRWTQLNSVLSGTGVANGYARITRKTGANPFVAYGVVVDGGTPQARSDDGAFVVADVEEPPASAELAAIRKVEAKAAELLAGGASGVDFARAVGAYMATLPEYQLTGVDEPFETAYGMFPNGRLHLVANNREADATGAGNVPAARPRPLVTELPRSGFARLAQSFGETRFTQEPVDDLAAVFKDPGGYAIRPGRNGDARLSTLRTISGDGFFYFNTHGGRAFKTRDGSGPGFFSMQSSTIVTPVTERFAEIVADFAAGRITYQTEPNFQQAYDPRLARMVDLVDTRYGVTSEFVKQYWSFEPFSMLFFNVCWSGYTADPEGAKPFIDACLAKKAGVYFGWSKRANSGTCFDTVRYFVDRVIGASQFMKESPDQRAFPWELVLEDMRQHHPNLAHDQRTGADLVAFPQGGPSVVLDPSIEELLVNEYDGTMFLKGYFGSVQGKVFVESTELHVRTWGADTIVADLPLKDAGSKGEVHVEVAGAPGKVRKSNARQLAEWNVPVQYTFNDVFGTTGWIIAGTGAFRFRGDVGGSRTKPGTTPVLPVRGMFPTKDSSMHFVASGSHTDTCTSTISGSATLGSQTSGNLAFFVLAALDIDARPPQTGTLGLAYGALAGSFPFTLTVSGGPNCSGTYPLPFSFGELEGPHEFLQPTEMGPNVPATSLHLSLDGTFRIGFKHYLDRRLSGELTIDAGPAQPAPVIKTDLPQ